MMHIMKALAWFTDHTYNWNTFQTNKMHSILVAPDSALLENVFENGLFDAMWSSKL